MKHSDLIGGSSAKRRIQCTGSAALEAQFPNEESEDALQGTALHALMYQVMMCEVGLPDPASDDPVLISWEEEDGEGNPCLRTFEASADILRERFFPVYQALRDLIERYEVSYWEMELDYALHKTCGPEVFGTTDFAGRGWNDSGRVLLQVDFKFGLGVEVHPEENDQLAFYATGLIDNDDPLTQDVDDLVFVILQPSVHGDSVEDVCKEWRTTRLWLDLWRSQLQRAYQRIVSGDVSYKSGPWCQFCRGAPACPVRNEALVKFKNDVPPELPANLSVAKLSQLLDVGKQAVQQYEAVVKYAEKLAMTGVSIPGWKLKESVGHRCFMNDKLGEDVAVRLLGSEAYAPKALKTPAQLEKTAKKMGVDFAPLAQLLHRPSRGGRLVPDSDPAPEMLVAAGPIELPAEIIDLAKHRK